MLALEPLEDRRMLDVGAGVSDPELVVGRSLSTWLAEGVGEGGLTVEYTVYNRRAEAMDNVLLSTRLGPGVSLRESSVVVARNGEELSWRLGTIEPFGRGTVRLVVSPEAGGALAIDAGARASGTLGGRAVEDASPPAFLRAGAVRLELLASTVDANALDPYIREQAALLDYDPARIVAFLRRDVSFESYVGSLRGARGTLWSGAGNALDEASLGVALMRASGIPARYAQGRLSDAQAASIIREMFPSVWQVLGYVDPQEKLSDPAADPRLLELVRDHTWWQYDTGSGFVDGQTVLPSASFLPAPESTYGEVPQALRHRVEFRIRAEFAGGLSGLLGGNPPTTVLSVTYPSAELVGKLATVGHFVASNTAGGLIFSSTTNTYSPYLNLVDVAPGAPETLTRGDDYQELLTNFPLGSRILTGVFADIVLAGPGLADRTLSRALVDRIGFAGRQNGTTAGLAVAPDAGPALSERDAFTFLVRSGDQAVVPVANWLARFSSTYQQMQALQNPATADLGRSAQVFRQANAELTGFKALEFAIQSDDRLKDLANTMMVKSYIDRPHVTLVSLRDEEVEGRVAMSMDLIEEDFHVVAYPGQDISVEANFRMAAGLYQTLIETEAFQSEQGPSGLSAMTVFAAAEAQGIGLLYLVPGQQPQLAALSLSSIAQARISAALSSGLTVVAPSRPPQVEGQTAMAWYEINPATGQLVSVLENGSHGVMAQFGALLGRIRIATLNALELLGQQVVTFVARWIVMPSIALYRWIQAKVFPVVRDQFKRILDALKPTTPQKIEKVREEVAKLKKELEALEKVAPRKPALDILEGTVSRIDPFEARINEIRAALALLGSIDPPVPSHLLGIVPGIDIPEGDLVSIQRDPLLTVPFDGAELPTAFRLNVRNDGAKEETFRISVPETVPGFALRQSATTLTIPAGEIGVTGLYLFPSPTQGIPTPGTPVSLRVEIRNEGGPARSASTTFAMPSVHGLTIEADPPALSSLPGAPVTTTLRVRAVGNVGESVSMNFDLAAGLTAAAVEPFTLAAGETRVIPITLTPAAATPLNSTLTARVRASFGPAGSPMAQELAISVRTAVPGAKELLDAATDAGRLGMPALAARLTDLSTGLTTLVQNPADAVARSQSLAALDATSRQLDGEPVLAGFSPALRAAGAVLAAASTPEAVRVAALAMGQALANLGAAIRGQAERGFTMALAPNSAVVQPGAPARYDVEIRNTGTTRTTYIFGVSGLPAGLAAAFNRPSVTLDPGAFVQLGPDGVRLEITQTGTGVLVPATFTVTATAQEAPVVTQGVPATLTVRAAFVQVTQVDAMPRFVEPGGAVAISARVLNVAGRRQEMTASYVLRDAGGQVVRSSAAVPFVADVQASIAGLTLPALGTTGLARGDYAIEVILRDANGQPVPGGSARGSVQVGSPVGGSLVVSPGTLAQGDGTVTNTLLIELKQPVQSGDPLVLLGQVDTAGTGSSVALLGNLAYVSGTEDVSIVDISDPANPRILSTFGADQIVLGGSNRVGIFGDRLIIVSTPIINATKFDLITYNIADPLNPLFQGKAPINYVFAGGWTVQGSTMLMPVGSVSTFFGGITGRTGDLLSIDLSDPTQPRLADVFFNNRGPTGGGDFVHNSARFVNDNVSYVTSTSSQGSNTQAGIGRLRVLDVSDPANLVLVQNFDLPGTNELFSLSIQGNRAYVIGSTGGLRNPFGTLANFGQTGNLTFTILDTTTPTNPRILGSTLVTPNTFPTRGQSGGVIGTDLIGLPNGLFAVSGTIRDGKSGLLIIDPGDPFDIQTAFVETSAIPGGLTTRDGKLYAASADGLSVFDIGNLLGNSVTVRVAVPKGIGVSVVPGSFNTAPDRVEPGVEADTLVWERRLGAAGSTLRMTWQSRVDGLRGDEARPVTLGARVDYVHSGTPGRLELPPTRVAAQPILGLDPPTRIARPGAGATYELILRNPTGSAVTYNLAIGGVPAGWVQMAPTVAVAARSTVRVPLTLTSDVFSALGERGFTVRATAATGAAADVQGTLVLAGEPMPAPDAEAYGVVVALRPGRATAGQGTSAEFLVRVVNTGSTTARFALEAIGLPQGVAAEFGGATVEVPPGASNFREVRLRLTPSPGMAVGDLAFGVRAALATPPPRVTASDEAAGLLTVARSGVRVELDPPVGEPGAGYRMSVTNTGSAEETFELALAGPAALVATLEATRVTLPPGGSRVVAISTRGAGFAVPGELALIGLATSASDPAVRDDASAALMVAGSVGLAARLDPAEQVLPGPGVGTFLLLVENTGNTEDAFTAEIVGVDGPVTASLEGLDGISARSVPVFRLPGLATGAILIRADLSAMGTGRITVRVRSLGDPARSTTAVATLRAGAVAEAPPATITTVQRLGYHAQPTRLVVSFSTDMDAASAENLANYRLIAAGRDGKLGTRDDRVVRLRSASYDPATSTVTLQPFRRLQLRGRFWLAVSEPGSAGLIDRGGRLLDGDADGRAGGLFRTLITRRNLVMPAASRRPARPIPVRAAARVHPVAPARPSAGAPSGLI